MFLLFSIYHVKCCTVWLQEFSSISWHAAYIDTTEGGILWNFKRKNTDTVQTSGSWRCVGDGWVSSVGLWVVWLLSEAAGSHNDFQRASCEGLARWSQDNSD